MAAALAHFGYGMELKESYMHLSRKERPSLWTWMQKPRNAWVHYILAIHKGKEGPLGADQGRQALRHLHGGTLAVRVRRPPQGRRIMEVFEVRKALGV